MTGFWRNWLMLWGWGVVLFGAVLCGAAFEATDAPVRALYDLFDGPGDPSWDAHLRFSVGLMGAVSLGWGLTLLAAFKGAFALGEKAGPLWRGLWTSMLIWYVIDSTISCATGFWMNAVSNTVLLVLLAIPILKNGVLRG